MAQILRLYIQYEHLAASDLADVIRGMDDLYRLAIKRAPESEGYYLSVAGVHTGRSIEIKFSDGWVPKLSSGRGGKVVLKVPGIYILGWLLVSAHNAIVDGLVKEKELWFARQLPPQIVKELESESCRPLREKAKTEVERLLGKGPFKRIELDDLRLKNTVVEKPVALPDAILDPMDRLRAPERPSVVLAPNLTDAQFASLERRLAAKGVRMIRAIDTGIDMPAVIVLEMRDAADLSHIKVLKSDFPKIPILVINRTSVPQIAHMIEGALAR